MYEIRDSGSTVGYIWKHVRAGASEDRRCMRRALPATPIRDAVTVVYSEGDRAITDLLHSEKQCRLFGDERVAKTYLSVPHAWLADNAARHDGELRI